VQAPGNTKLLNEIERIVLGRIAAGRLVLPASGAVAQKCLSLLRDPDFQQRKLIALVETEPLLAATVLRAGSNAQFGGSSLRLEQAVGRLGVQRLKTVIVEFSTRELFQSSDRRIAAANKKLWDHSIAVAVLARDFAALVGNNIDGDTAYLAGLMHDIGKPVLGAMLLEVERQLSSQKTCVIDPDVWVATVEGAHRKIGVAIATEWKLADEIAGAIRDCSDYDAANRHGPANIVRFANAVAKREGYATGPIDAADIDALILVGRSLLGVEEAPVNRLAAGLKDRIAQGG
jgi:putative nucleotidyltransferase with HDIG domain